MANRKSYTSFSTSHQPRFYASPNFLKMGIKYLNLSSFIQVSTIKDETSAARFHYINKKASIRWQDSAPPISGYWPTSEPNAGDHDFPLTGSNFGNLTAFRAIWKVAQDGTCFPNQRLYWVMWIPWVNCSYNMIVIYIRNNSAVIFCRRPIHVFGTVYFKMR